MLQSTQKKIKNKKNLGVKENPSLFTERPHFKLPTLATNPSLPDRLV